MNPSWGRSFFFLRWSQYLLFNKTTSFCINISISGAVVIQKKSVSNIFPSYWYGALVFDRGSEYNLKSALYIQAFENNKCWNFWCSGLREKYFWRQHTPYSLFCNYLLFRKCLVLQFNNLKLPFHKWTDGRRTICDQKSLPEP